jgi:hypothetical protein
MAIEILITNSRDIIRAVDQLHDLWLDVEAIDWDRQAQRVRIPFAERSEKLVARNYEKWLVIESAQTLVIRDTEKVGFYDLNRISFKDGLLTLECGVPLKIEIGVGWGR